MNGKKSVLLTHSDLDGTGCLVVTDYFNLDFTRVKVCNYEEMSDDEYFCMLSDFDEVWYADFSPETESLYNRLIEAEKTVFIFDHHESSKWVKGKENCFHDDNKCGTKLFYEYFRTRRDPTILKDFIELVNVYDLWLLEDPRREEAENLNRILYGSLQYYFKGLSRYKRFVGEIIIKLKSGRDRWFLDDSDNGKIARAIEKEAKEFAKALKMLQRRVDSKGNTFGVFKACSKISQSCSKLLNSLTDVSYVICLNTWDGMNGKFSIRSRKDDFNLLQLEGCKGHEEAAGGSLSPGDALKFWEGKIYDFPYLEE